MKNKKYFINSFLACAFVLLTTMQARAQNTTTLLYVPPTKAAYIGFGTGINHYTGILGVNIEVPLNKQVALMGTAGIGSWGRKLGISGRYYFKDVRGGSAISAGFSRASGLNDITTEQEVVDDNGGLDNTDVTMDWKAVNCINIAYIYAINLKDKHKIAFSVGYSAKITSNPYVITSNHTLSNTSESVMNILTPGGISLGVDFLFGVGNK